MGIPGRKSWTEELELKRRYAELTPKHFKFLKKMQESEEPADNKWAAEQLGKVFVKAVPTTVAGDEDNPLEVNVTGVEITVRNDKD